MVNNAKQPMAERDDGSLPSAAGAQAKIDSLQHKVLLTGSGPGTLSEDTAEPVIAAAGLAGFTDTGTFVIARTDSGPITWKPAASAEVSKAPFFRPASAA